MTTSLSCCSPKIQFFLFRDQIFMVAILFLFLDSSGLPVDAVNLPGLQIRLSQQGLNYGASVAVDILAKSVPKVKIPDQSGTSKIKVGKVSYQVTNMHITSFVKPGTNVAVNSRTGITWMMSNAGVSLNGNWAYKYKLGFIVIKDHGSFDGSVSGASISVTVTLGQDSTGHPTITSTGCSCNINSVRIKLHGGASWLYNLFIGSIERPLRSNLQKLICQEASKAINENARRELATLPIEIPIDKMWLFDYRLVSPPAFQSGYMDSFHKGEFFFKGDTTEAPFQASPIPASSTDRMVTIWVSDYILNTVGYVFYKHNILRHILTRSDLPDDQKGFLNTTCSGLECFGLLVPQAGEIFPNASVEIEMLASNSPTANISSENIRGDFRGILIYRARLINGSLADMFKTDVSVKVTLTVSLAASSDNLVLKGKVTSLIPTIKVIDSQIGPILGPVLDLAFKLASSLYIIPKLNEVGQKGIPIPSIKHVQFTNMKLEMNNHYLRASTDVSYSSSGQSSNVLRFIPIAV